MPLYINMKYVPCKVNDGSIEVFFTVFYLVNREKL